MKTPHFDGQSPSEKQSIKKIEPYFMDSIFQPVDVRMNGNLIVEFMSDLELTASYDYDNYEKQGRLNELVRKFINFGINYEYKKPSGGYMEEESHIPGYIKVKKDDLNEMIIKKKIKIKIKNGELIIDGEHKEW